MAGISRRLQILRTEEDDEVAAGHDLEDKQFASTLARGLAVLRCFTPEEQLLGNKEFTERTGLSRPTITRLTYTLTRLGYLNYVPKLGRYRLAPGVLSLGYPLLAGLTIRQIARPFMQQLADHCHGNVSLAMRTGLEMIYVDTVRSTSGMIQPPDIGARFRIEIGASGRAYISACDEEERKALLGQLQAAAEHEWPLRLAMITEEMERYQERGYCISLIARPGIHAVAVPLRGPNSEIMAISCGVPEYELKGDALHSDIAPRLLSIARNIETAFGLTTSASHRHGDRR